MGLQPKELVWQKNSTGKVVRREVVGVFAPSKTWQTVAAIGR